MLIWATIFLLLALITGGLAFTETMGSALAIPELLFWVFILLFLVALGAHKLTKRNL